MSWVTRPNVFPVLRRILPILTLGIALAAPARASADATSSSDATEPSGPSTPRFALTRADAWFGGAAVSAIAIAAAFDERVAKQAQRSNGSTSGRIADAAQPFGTPALVGPALVAAWGAGKLLGQSRLSDAGVRIGGAVLAAGIIAEGIKISAGRLRPNEAPGDPDEFEPFSGKDSFPSGHSTVAFATAAALDRETTSRWVPLVAYPAAGLVGWSRLRDRRHWLSDVVAGSLLGYWTANKAEDALRAREAHTGRKLGWMIELGAASPMVGARLSF